MSFTPETFSQLMNQISSSSSLLEKVRILNEAGKGASAIILTAGPSLNRYNKKRLEEICEGKIVICVKQAIDICPVPCHFHLLNPWNHKTYSYRNHKPIVIFESRGASAAQQAETVADLHFPVNPNASREDWLAKTRDFDGYLFSETLVRPWGPGILYELGFYLIVHLGVRNTIVLGWDLSMDSRGTVNHFYESRLERFRKRLRGYMQSRDKNQRENASFAGEFKVVAESTCDLYQWMKSKGCELSLPSENAVACRSIPRTRLLL